MSAPARKLISYSVISLPEIIQNFHMTCLCLLKLFFTGAGDRHWRWAHFIHNFQNWLIDWRQPVKVSITLSVSKAHALAGDLTFQTAVFQGPWRSKGFLLSGARSEMSRLQSHRPSLQDQAHLNIWIFFVLIALADVSVVDYRICTFAFGGTVFYFK